MNPFKLWTKNELYEKFKNWYNIFAYIIIFVQVYIYIYVCV